MADANALHVRRLLLVANPISGGGRGRRLAPQLADALAARGVTADVYLTQRAGDARERAERLETGYDGVVALGGDGTVNEVLNGLRDPTTPLGVLPVGTANVLALELRLPRDPVGAADVLAAGSVCRAAIARCNGRRFLLFVGIGMDGAIVHRLSQVRTGTLGKHKWLGPLLHTVRHWPRSRLTATLADGTRLEDLSSVLITRVRSYGGIMRLPDAELESGVLHVLAFRMRSRTAWLYHGLCATVGRLRSGAHLSIHRTTSLRVEGEAPFQIDGDYGGHGPIDVELLPETARLFAPTV